MSCSFLIHPPSLFSVVQPRLQTEMLYAHAQDFDVRFVCAHLSVSPLRLCQAMEDTPRKRRRLGGVCV
jgi:hypothetical protein